MILKNGYRTFYKQSVISLFKIHVLLYQENYTQMLQTYVDHVSSASSSFL